MRGMVRVRWGRSERSRAARDERAAAGMRRLLLEGFRAPAPLEAAKVVAAVLADRLGAERTAVLFFTGPGRLQVQLATVGIAPTVEAAIRESLDRLERDPTRSPGWTRNRTATAVEVVHDVTGYPIRPGGVVDLCGGRAYLGVPLLGPDGPVGTVICCVGAPRRWRSEEIEDATRLAMGGAAVIEAARRGEAERRTRRELEYRATHDPLTGLVNREAFADRLTGALEARDGCGVAVLVVDLDRFKQVNDRLGHAAGDRLLELAAKRLAAAVRPTDVVGRLGGDEFAAAMTAEEAGPVALGTAERIATSLAIPFALGPDTAAVEASVGVAVSPDHGRDAETLLANADAAMYHAKRTGRAFSLYRLVAGAPPALRRPAG